MEPSDHSLSDINKCNDISNIYPESAETTACKEVNSLTISTETKLREKSNGSININCKRLQNVDNNVSEIFIGKETFIADGSNSLVENFERRETGTCSVYGEGQKSIDYKENCTHETDTSVKETSVCDISSSNVLDKENEDVCYSSANEINISNIVPPEVNVCDNSLKDINISNSAPPEVHVSDNSLKEIDISSNAPPEVNVCDSSVKKADLSNKVLKEIDKSLNEVDVSDNSLKEAHISSNSLKEVDVSHNSLKEVDVSNNSLKEVVSNKSLKEAVSNNSSKEVVSDNSLKEAVSDNSLKEVDISSNSQRDVDGSNLSPKESDVCDSSLKKLDTCDNSANECTSSFAAIGMISTENNNGLLENIDSNSSSAANLDVDSSQTVDETLEDKNSLSGGSNPLTGDVCCSEVSSDCVNIVAESPLGICTESNSQNCPPSLLLPDDSLSLTVPVDSVIRSNNNEESIDSISFLPKSHTILSENDPLFSEVLNSASTTTFVVQNCFTAKDQPALSCVEKVLEEPIMQRVIEGSLQPMDIHSLGDGCKEDPLFIGVSQGVEPEDGKIELFLPEPQAITETYNDDSIELTDLTEPPPVQLETPKESKIDEEESSIPDPILKMNEMDPAKDSKGTSPETEGKPSILKIMPIKNGHGLWDIEELRMVLEDKGSVLLRLCAAPEAGNEDIIEGPQADFTALLLEDAFHIPDAEFSGDLGPSILDQMSNSSFDFFPPAWKEPRVQSTPKRKSLPPPFPQTPLFWGPQKPPNLTARGRKRGRPPLHNRPWMTKSKAAPPAPQPAASRYFDDPIKFRPPTPPPSFVPPDGANRAVGILEAALAKAGGEPDPRISCASLSGVKRPAPGSLLSQRLRLAKQEKETDQPAPAEDVDDVSATSDDISDVKDDVRSNFNKPKRLGNKLMCLHCPMLFRKKAALTAHMRLRHKQLRKCPVCGESVRVTAKYGIKFHLLKEHRNTKPFPCTDCDESFNLEHHLKNHRKLTHLRTPPTAPSSDEEPDEPDEPSKVEEEPPIEDIEPPPTEDVVEEEEDPLALDPPTTKVQTEEDSPPSSPTPPKMRLRSQRGEGEASSSASGDESDDEDDSDSSSSSSSLKTEKQRYFCDSCDAGFSHVFKLRHHKKKRHARQGRVTRNRGPGSGPAKDRREGGLRCGVCGRESRNEEQFRLHALKHTTQTPRLPPRLPPQPTDQKKLVEPPPSKRNPERATTRLSKATAASLLQEEDTRDSDEEEPPNRGNERPPYIVRKGRVFECLRCSLTFKREKQMTYHLKKIHETLYPFRKCPHCTRVFRSSGPYTRHMSQHTGKRCPVDGCRAKYKVLRLIKKHQRHAHPELPHKCQRCVQLYATEEELEAHSEEVHKRADAEKRDEDEEEESEEEEEEKVKEEVKGGRAWRAKEREKRLLKNKSPSPPPPPPPQKKGKKPVLSHASAASHKRKKEKSDDEEEVVVIRRRIPATASSVRRARTSAISYREDEEDDLEEQLALQRTVAFSPPKKGLKPLSKPPPSSPPPPPPPPPVLPPPPPPPPPKIHPPVPKGGTSGVGVRSSPAADKVTKRPTATAGSAPFLAQTNPLKNLREALMMQSKAKQQEQKAKDPLVVKPKRSYVRRAPYKKRKVDNSWTAALKQQQGPIPVHSSSSGSPYSPAITADVVRRVAESLLNRHQEQQQKKLFQTKRKKITPSLVNYGPNKSQLPRIAYSTLVAAATADSVESSLSGMGDSEDYGDTGSSRGGYSAERRSSNSVPDDDDSANKVLRFDNF